MKLREDIVFYKYNENTFHMYDERNDKHFHIGLEQKEWLELFDGKRTLDEIKNLIPKQYVEQFLEYVNKYNLLDDATTTSFPKFNLFKIKIKLANVNLLLNKMYKQCVVYTNILNRSFPFVILCNLFLLYRNVNNFMIYADQVMRSSSIAVSMICSYILIIITGFFHEFSHACVAKANNIAIPQIGIMLFYFNPALYVDLSGARILSNKTKRIEILSAGIKMNNLTLFLCLVVVSCCRSSLIRNILSIYIILDLMMILINIIPFVEFDGYYIWSELMDTTNLKLTTSIQIKFLLKGQFNKVQLHYILYFIYSIIFSSAFLALGLTSLISIMKTIMIIPNFITITLLFFTIALNFRHQMKKR